MTCMPASRSARATTLMPRSWPSRPTLASTMRGGLSAWDMRCFLKEPAGALLLHRRPPLRRDLHLQDRLAELQGVVGLERELLARRDGGAVEEGQPARVGDGQAVRIE